MHSLRIFPRTGSALLGRGLTIGVLAAALVAGTAVVASATPITSPGGGESFTIEPGDTFRVGYDFTIPGNNQAVTVAWTDVQAVVDFTCPSGTAGSFTIPMPDYTTTVSDSQWYPSGDQSSPLVYQGTVTAPDGCGNGAAMHQNQIAVFTADVSSSPADVKLNYRFHDADENASGSWSGTDSVTTSPITQTTPKFIQAADGTAHEQAAATITLPSAPAAGDLLVVEVDTSETVPNTVTTSAVQDGSASFTLVGRYTAPDGGEMSIWTLPVTAGTGSTITATASSSPTDLGLAAMEYSGLTGATDGSSSASGYTTGGTVNSGTGAAAHVGDLVLGFEADSGWTVALGGDPAAGYATRVDLGDNYVAEILAEDKVATSAGLYSATSTITYTPTTAGLVDGYRLPGVPWVMATISFVA